MQYRIYNLSMLRPPMSLYIVFIPSRFCCIKLPKSRTLCGWIFSQVYTTTCDLINMIYFMVAVKLHTMNTECCYPQHIYQVNQPDTYFVCFKMHSFIFKMFWRLMYYNTHGAGANVVELQILRMTVCWKLAMISNECLRWDIWCILYCIIIWKVSEYSMWYCWNCECFNMLVTYVNAKENAMCQSHLRSGCCGLHGLCSIIFPVQIVWIRTWGRCGKTIHDRKENGFAENRVSEKIELCTGLTQNNRFG